MTDSFVHLHTHTEYSMLDGLSSLDSLVEKAVEDGMPAIGITDHGNMFGVPQFYKACKKAGINPIIGSELYQARESVDERPKRNKKTVEDDSGGESEEGTKLYYHLTALSETNEGYKNLIQLSSQAFTDGFYYKPRCDWSMLEAHSKGLIVTSGCLGGLVNQALLNNNPERALELAGRFQDIFGKGNFFIEIQNHGIDAQHETNPQLIDISRKINAPLLLTNDSHYTHQCDHEAHDALLCVQTRALISDTNRFKFHGDQHYLKSPAEMRSLFPELPEASDNTLAIAERCNVEIDFDTMHLPEYVIPVEWDSQGEYLRYLVYEGAKYRWGDNYSSETQSRLDYELGVIHDMGFDSYFLITWDLIRHARETNIAVGPARGSAGGSAVAYALQITDLDPIEHDLLFERFLNPSRVSMPDIDMDFDTRGRDEMIRYTAEKYGEDKVAQIITYSQVQARAALRDAARVLGFPPFMGDKLSKAMPKMIAGRNTPLRACFEKDPKYEQGYQDAAELRELVESDPDNERIVEIALGLEGARRSSGTHAAAVVISDIPITDVMPIIQEPDSKSATGFTPKRTQYDMHAVEELGFLKMDFLGLRNLDIIADTLSFIKENHGQNITMRDIPFDDPKTYEMLSEGNSIGVFQLESLQMRALLRRLKPDCFEDVCAVIALYRPGPMAANMHNDYADRKNGKQKAAPPHSDASDILKDTYQLMIYQEQMMFIAQKFAGYSMAEADNLRKAAGKKIREVMAKERVKFVEGCVNNGYTKKVGDDWFDMIEPFADYAFNKSHAYGYGIISVYTAWLKANYPIEYMTALLISSENDMDKMSVFLNECKRMGIEVKPPNILTSKSHFIPLEDSILFGLSSVKGVGDKAISLLVDIREQRGGFQDFFEVITHVPAKGGLTKGHYENLIKVGALGVPRSSALEHLEDIIAATKSDKKMAKKSAGTLSLFDQEDAEVDYDRWGSFRDKLTTEASDEDIQNWEKELLGMWITSHPLDGYEEQVESISSVSSADIQELEEDSIIVMAGLLTTVGKRRTKKGDDMAIIYITDFDGTFEGVVFPRTWRAFGSLLKKNQMVVIQGKVQDRGDENNLIIEAVSPLDDYEGEFSDSFKVTEKEIDAETISLFMDSGMMTEMLCEQLKNVLDSFPGNSPVEIITSKGERIDIQTSVKQVQELEETLVEVFGPDILMTGILD